MGNKDVRTNVRPFRPVRGVKPNEIACLLVQTGKAQGRLIPLSEGTSVIGRAPTSEIELDDDGVSRHHAKVIIDGRGKVSLIDLDSTNGTFLNRAQIERANVRPGDELQIGPEVAIRFCYRDQAEVERLTPTPAPEQDDAASLTARELQVARMAARGLTNAQIGKDLGISPRTVNSHLNKIYDRLDVHSRAALAVYLAERGLLP